MSDNRGQKRENAQTYLLVGVVAAASLYLLFGLAWELPAPFPSRFWNALATFAIIGIVSDSLSFKLPVAKVNTSVGFIPFIASVALFRHPWAMVIAGVTAVVVDLFVRHKPSVRVAFNTAQYMLATGLASLVYSRLGGSVSLESFEFTLVPFVGLVVTFFVVNKGSVSLAVSRSEERRVGKECRSRWSP